MARKQRTEKIAKARLEGAWEPFTQEQVDTWENGLDVVERTKVTYKLGLASFCEFARACGVNDPSEMDQELVLRFKEYLAECGKSASCQSLYLSGVRSFFKGLGGANPAANVKGGKLNHEFKKEALSVSQAKRLLRAYPGDDEASLRNRAVISLMLHTGLRDVEVVRADIGDMGTDSGFDVLRVQGKGHAEKDALVKLSPAVAESIEAYLDARGTRMEDAPLFASLSNNNKGGRLTTYSVSSIVKDALRSIGIDDKRHTAHSLRHTAVTLALMGGASDAQAQEMARHASITTTQIYSHRLNRLTNAAEDSVAKLLD